MTINRRVALAGSFFLLFTLMAVPVQAQSDWQNGFGTQISKVLQSPDPLVQDQGMRTLIRVADESDRALDLQPAAKPLLDIYDASTEATRRHTAVMALSKIDDPASYTTLLVMAMDEPNEQVRTAVLEAAAASHSIEDPTVAWAYNRLLQEASRSEPQS